MLTCRPVSSTLVKLACLALGIPDTHQSRYTLNVSHLCCVVHRRMQGTARGAVSQHDVGRFAPVDITDEDSHPRARTSLSAKEKAVRDDEKEEAAPPPAAAPAGTALRAIGSSRSPIMLNTVRPSPLENAKRFCLLQPLRSPSDFPDNVVEMAEEDDRCHYLSYGQASNSTQQSRGSPGPGSLVASSHREKGPRCRGEPTFFFVFVSSSGAASERCCLLFSPTFSVVVSAFSGRCRLRSCCWYTARTHAPTHA